MNHLNSNSWNFGGRRECNFQKYDQLNIQNQVTFFELIFELQTLNVELFAVRYLPWNLVCLSKSQTCSSWHLQQILCKNYSHIRTDIELCRIFGISLFTSRKSGQFDPWSVPITIRERISLFLSWMLLPNRDITNVA